MRKCNEARLVWEWVPVKLAQNISGVLADLSAYTGTGAASQVLRRPPAGHRILRLERAFMVHDRFLIDSWFDCLLRKHRYF